LIWLRTVSKPGCSCKPRDDGFKKRTTIPDGDGAVARALFDELVNHGRGLFEKRRVMRKSRPFALA
jgi:hypothetical protein